MFWKVVLAVFRCLETNFYHAVVATLAVSGTGRMAIDIHSASSNRQSVGSRKSTRWWPTHADCRNHAFWKTSSRTRSSHKWSTRMCVMTCLFPNLQQPSSSSSGGSRTWRSTQPNEQQDRFQWNCIRSRILPTWVTHDWFHPQTTLTAATLPQ